MAFSWAPINLCCWHMWHEECLRHQKCPQCSQGSPLISKESHRSGFWPYTCQGGGSCWPNPLPICAVEEEEWFWRRTMKSNSCLFLWDIVEADGYFCFPKNWVLGVFLHNSLMKKMVWHKRKESRMEGKRNWISSNFCHLGKWSVHRPPANKCLES